VTVGSYRAIAFFSMFEKKKKMTATHCRLLLWWCFKEEKGDGNSCRHLPFLYNTTTLPSPSSLCLRRRR
jgi:hypothetical protein